MYTKAKVMTKSGLDMIIETRIKDYDEIMNEINGIEGVISVSLISHKGETVY